MNIVFQRNYQRIFGTFPLRGDKAKQAVATAIEVGYRHFDTAQMYENEAEVGEALAASGIARDQLCITTKVTPGNFASDAFMPSVKQSLENLQVDAVDLLLLHWPPFDGSDIESSLRLLDQAHKEGLARNVGISNYTSAMMRQAKEIVDAPLAANQVEFHPLLNQDILLATSAETRIPLTAYCSVARGEVFRHQDFEEIGKGYGKTAGQVVLRWILQTGVAPITMSTNPDNIKANYEIMDFSLSFADMARINELTKTNFRVVDKDRVPNAPDWD